MYATLFLLLLALGLWLVILPSRTLKEKLSSKRFLVRGLGCLLILLSCILLYAVLSGAVTLPLLR